MSEWDDGDRLKIPAPTGGTLSDGDKGDITVSASGATWTIDAGAVTLAKQANMATASVVYRKTAGDGAPEVQTLATLKTDLGLTGTNSGDQTSIVGITGTKAQFDTAVTDGNFLYSGDVTQYTDEMAQDAVGGMVDTTLVYTDATPLLSRAALTGAVTASAGSNATSLGSFTKAQLTAAVSDGDPLYVGDITGNATHTGDATGATALTVVKIQGKDFPTLSAADDQKYPKYVSASNAFVMTTLAGGGNVSNTGTPANNQVAVWTDATTIEGDTALTFDTTTDTLSVGTGGVMVTGTIELGAATDTTISRAAAGVIAVEGVPILKATSGVGATPTSSTTTAITHGLGRTPVIVRIWGKSGFTSSTSATPVTSSEGVWTSSGNTCIYQAENGTTTIAAQTSTAFSIHLSTSVGNIITGVIQNVGATTFDIVWTETGTHTRGVYMWEAQ